MTKEKRKAYDIKYSRTKQGVISRIYNNQKQNSRKRGHLSPTYSKEWLRVWLLGNLEFHRLYDIWVHSGCDKYLKPSIDRVDDSLGYTKNNIQLTTWRENEAKASSDRREGRLDAMRSHKAILQFTIHGELIAEHVSAHSAERDTGVWQTNISKCCLGRKNYKSAGGYIWKYKIL